MYVKVLNNGVELPVHETEMSAGVDLQVTALRRLYSGNKEVSIQDKLQTSIERGYFYLRAFERALLGTNLFIQLPIGKQLEIRDRSGNALKRGLFVANSPGTIDADYRHEVGIIIYNSTPYLNKINFGEKLAQAVLMDYHKIEWEIVEKLDEVFDRTGGFGSTTKKERRQS